MRTLLVLMMAASACAPAEDDHLDVTYDACLPVEVVPAADLSEAELAALDQAISLWRSVGIDAFTREATGAIQRLPLRFDRAAPMFHGLYDDEAGVVIINREMGAGPGALAVTIAHELGHALGLWHVEHRSSVMNPGNSHLPPNEVDVADIMAIWGPCSEP